MGWAIRRADGTYRLWSRWEKLGVLGGGEEYEERDTAPEVAPSRATQDADVVRDAYVAAKQAIEDFAANSTLTTAKPAIIKLGQCVEELLRALNRRIQ